jgi:hypothetical protein
MKSDVFFLLRKCKGRNPLAAGLHAAYANWAFLCAFAWTYRRKALLLWLCSTNGLLWDLLWNLKDGPCFPCRKRGWTLSEAWRMEAYSHWTIIYSQKKLLKKKKTTPKKKLTLDYQSSRPKWSKALLYFVAMQSRSTPEAYSDHDV